VARAFREVITRCYICGFALTPGNTNASSFCFVTGVPGAGKTLAGLNLVTHRAKAHEEEHAVFLSGNGPLVDVLREALEQIPVEFTHSLRA
jgi:hypothetical protein